MGLTKWVVVVFVLLDIGAQSAVGNADMVFKVFSATSKSIVFQWDKVAGATSYKITASNKNTPDQIISYATFGANTVMGSINTGLTPNTNYVYNIEAMDASGAPHTGSVEHTTAPDRMDPLVSLKPKDSTTLVLEFVPEAGVSKYIIRVQNSQSYFREFEVTASPAEITSLQPYTEYKVSALAANDGGQSQPTAPLTSKTLLPRPTLQSSSPSNSTIDLSWDTVGQAVLYTMCLTKYDTVEKISLNSSGTTLTFTGLDAGALYLIEGYAWDAEGRKGERSYTNQTTRPPTPQSVIVSMSNTNNQPGLSVSWTIQPNLYGVVEYHVTSDQGQTCNTTSLSCDLWAVSCGKVHSVQVVAQNDAGPSVPSSPVVFTTIPCPPQNLDLSENSTGSCSFSWDPALYAGSYRAFIRNGVGNDEICNTTSTSCNFTCDCGYTYLTSVFAINEAGLSSEGPSLNHTTWPCCPNSVTVSLVSTDSLEIEWAAARGAETYETRAAGSSETVHCNDTAPVCVLSDLTCDMSYSIVVTPCNDISGCNRDCPPSTKDTAPCPPTNLLLTPVDSQTVNVSWTTSNRDAKYTVTATGGGKSYTCPTMGSTCNLTGLTCGNTYEVGVVAISNAGESLPSYTELLETEPCCPSALSVEQVTQAMTNVSWSTAAGAHTFLTSLTSPKGHARCHTEDSHCLMGCITCGTSYNVTMEVYSVTGRKSNCSYKGFSSSICCPSGVRLYKAGSNSLRVYWRSSPGSTYNTEVDLTGVSHNYTCRADAGQNNCDVTNVQCGEVYEVVVAPLQADGTKVRFCAHRKYSVNCSGGSSVGTVLFRGRRSVE